MTQAADLKHSHLGSFKTDLWTGHAHRYGGSGISTFLKAPLGKSNAAWFGVPGLREGPRWEGKREKRMKKIEQSFGDEWDNIK